MITIDSQKSIVTVLDKDGEKAEYPFESNEAFSIISDIWLRLGWDNKYVYSFTWMGRPIIQLPEDMIRIQEIIYSVKPNVIIETGVAHGGSLIFYASLLKAMGINGKVIGIDIEIRPHNLKAITEHELFEYIKLIEGNSINDFTVQKAKTFVNESDNVLVMLDSNHSKQHVYDELNSYSGLVSIGSYIIAADGIMGNVAGGPRTEKDWIWNNPKEAAIEFVKENSNFVIEEPKFIFNEGNITERVTYWPSAFIKRIK